MSRIIAPQWVNRRRRGEGRPRHEARRLARDMRDIARIRPGSLMCFFDARDLDLSDTDPVSSWPDAGPAGNDISQGTGAAQPTYRATGLGGNPAVEFDGTDDVLEGPFGDELDYPGGTLTTPSTFLITHKVATPGNTAAVMGADTDGGDDYYLNTVNSDYAIQIGGSRTDDEDNDRVSSSVHIVVVVAYEGDFYFRVDGHPRHSTASNDDFGRSFDRWFLGGEPGENFCDTTVGIAAHWSTTLTPAEVMRAEEYCADAYGVTLAYD